MERKRIKNEEKEQRKGEGIKRNRMEKMNYI
jgi:hypothetical protein